MRGLVFISLLSLNVSYAQLYVSNTKHQNNYLEVFKDSAQVDVIRTHCHHWCITKWLCNEMLYSKKSGDTIFSGKRAHVLKKRGAMVLCYKDPYKNKYRKIELEKCTLDLRDPLRKEAYERMKSDHLNRASDSLCGPLRPFWRGPSILKLTDEQRALPFKDLRIVVDALYDSIYNNIIEHRDTVIVKYYQKIDSLNIMDSTTAFSLLAQTNYDLFCGKYMLKQMAQERPELLIRYIDKNCYNRNLVLKTIRYHNDLYQITSDIRSCPVKKTKGKKLLVKQRTKRVAGDVAGGVLFTTAILAELALIPLLIIAISRN